MSPMIVVTGRRRGLGADNGGYCASKDAVARG